MVALATFSQALPQSFARRITYGREVRKGCYGRRGAESYGSCVMADPAKESKACVAHSEVSDCRLTPNAIGLYSHRSPDSLGSAGGKIRKLGSRAARAWVFAR